MSINVDAILQIIQDLRAQLEVWGINNDVLLALGAVAALLFMISLREVVSWYFRVNQVRDEVRSLRSQVYNLEQTLKEVLIAVKDPELARDFSTPPLGKEELLKIAESMRDETRTPRFNFDH